MLRKDIILQFCLFLSLTQVLSVPELNSQSVYLAIQTGHSSTPRVLAISKDNRLIYTCDESQYYLWDIYLGKQIASIRQDGIYSSEASGLFSKLDRDTLKSRLDGDVVFGDYWIRKIDTLTRKPVFKKTSKYNDFSFTDVAVSRKFNLIVGGNEDSFIYVYDLESGDERKILREHLAPVSNILFSPDNSIFASASKDRTVIIWDTKTLTPLKRLYGKVFRKTSVAFNKDGDYLYVGDEFGGITRLNLDPARMESAYSKTHNSRVNDILFLDKDLFASCGDDNMICLSDPETLATKREMVFHKFPLSTRYLRSKNALKKGYAFHIYSMADTLFRSGNIIFVRGHFKRKWGSFTYQEKALERSFTVPEAGEDVTISSQVNDQDSYSILKDRLIHIREDGSRSLFEGHTTTVTDFSVHPGKGLVATSSDDGSVKIWDMKTDSLLLTILIAEEKILFLNPDDYYMGDRSLFEMAGFRVGDRYFSPEQFDMKFNRPDLVLISVNYPDKELIRAYNKAYLKRLQFYGFSEEMFNSDFHLPEVSILNEAELPIATSSDYIDLRILAKDTKYMINRITILVNDVPVSGRKGYSVSTKDPEGAKYDQKITLSPGLNRIEVGCVNEKGVESLKKTISVIHNYIPKSKPDLYLIGISASQFEQRSYNLKYAVKDGQDLANKFKAAKLYRNVYIDTLFDRNVLKNNIFKLKEKILKSSVNDHVIVFISGHGLLDRNLDFYYAAYNTDFRAPAVNGIPFEMIENLIDSIPARQKLLLVDACHSGEVDKNEISAIAQGKKETEEAIVFRGAPIEIKEYSFRGDSTYTGSGIGLKNSFDLMQEYFANINRGSGAYIISASAGKGYALESDSWENGAFTFSLLNCLDSNAADKNRDRQISVSELRNFVINYVQSLTKGKQKPTSRSENFSNDFIVW